MRIICNSIINKDYNLLISIKNGDKCQLKELIMPFPFKGKKSQFKDYKKFRILKGVVTQCTFLARDEEDAELYIDKVREKNAENQSSGS